MSKSRAEVNRYFHGDVDLGSGNSADYVVAHAERQRQRGKNPSVRYKDASNPRDALEAAQADIEARTDNADDYTASFSGRIAIIKAWSDPQRDMANRYAEARMESNGATGAIVQGVKNDEVIQAPLHYRVSEEGTVHLMLPI